MTDEIILPVLYGRLWHTTHPDRYSGILTSGAILPEPNLPDLEREKTRDGKDGYSFVRAPVSYTHLDVYKRQARYCEPQQRTGARKNVGWHA